jgi:hypothetical protein
MSLIGILGVSFIFALNWQISDIINPEGDELCLDVLEVFITGDGGFFGDKDMSLGVY